MPTDIAKDTVCRFDDLSSADVARVGGKSASLGEMIRMLKYQGIPVPEGFATTAEAYREFLRANELPDQISALLEELQSGEKPLEKVDRSILSGGTLDEQDV